MAHELEIAANGIVSFAFVSKNGMPWHKLGTPVTDDLTPDEMAEAAHLTWLLEKTPVYDEFGAKLPGVFQLRRDFDRKFYDTVGAIYKPVQPKQALAFFANFVKAGHMKMETAGSLNDGARIFALAKMDASFTLPGGDLNETYMLLSSPNRKNESMTVRFCRTRVVCANTERMAIQEGLKYIKIPHVGEFNDEARDKAAELMGLASIATKNYGEAAYSLATTTARDEDVVDYIHQLTGGKLLDQMLNARQKQNEEIDVMEHLLAAERKREHAKKEDLNKLGKSILEAMINSPGADMKSARNTWWGAVNGVTYVADHVGNKDISKRYESAWFGGKAELKDKAFELALEYAGVKQN